MCNRDIYEKYVFVEQQIKNDGQTQYVRLK